MSLILNGTTGISDVDGTAAAPALTGTDSNTGIFFPAADTIGFAEGGVEAMRIDSSGNVGIGTSSPGAPLTIRSFGATGRAADINGSDVLMDGNGAFDLVMGDGGFAYMSLSTTDNAASMKIRNYSGNSDIAVFERISGNVGIGTSSPSQKLTIAGAGTAARLEIINTSDANRGGYLRDTGSSFELGTNSGVRPLAFAFDGSEKARIDTSGNLLVNTTTSNAKLTVVNNAFAISGECTAVINSGVAFFSKRTSNGIQMRFDQSGTICGDIITTGSTTAYGTSSDYRLKNTIAPMTGALVKVGLLKPVTYKWNLDGSESQGFIAHELQTVVPECVTGEKDATETVEVKDENGNVTSTEQRPVYQGIDTSFLVATLTAAIQEQQALITALTTRITALEAI